MQVYAGDFEWDSEKERDNICKHGVDFYTAAKVFKDPNVRIFIDSKHSKSEARLFAISKIDDRIMMVRFTYRGDKIRIFGAGYWRKGEEYYEKKKNI
jgi:uncharacterized DUF497 family protein